MEDSLNSCFIDLSALLCIPERGTGLVKEELSMGRIHSSILSLKIPASNNIHTFWRKKEPWEWKKVESGFLDLFRWTLHMPRRQKDLVNFSSLFHKWKQYYLNTMDYQLSQRKQKTCSTKEKNIFILKSYFIWLLCKNRTFIALNVFLFYLVCHVSREVKFQGKSSGKDCVSRRTKTNKEIWDSRIQEKVK